MRRLIADVYKLIYKRTHAKYVSIYGAVAFVTILNLITIQGLGQLMEGWLGLIRYVRVLFVFPYVIGTAVLLFIINVLIMLPFSNLRKDWQKPPLVIPMAVYFLVCVLLFLYIHYGNNLF